MKTSTLARLHGAAKLALGAAAVAALAVGMAAPAAAQTSVNLNIGQPGFYGQLNIGGYPPPAVYYPQPVVIERRVIGPPIYLRVPEGHRRHWAQHCYRYNACGRQVFFVQDGWYNNTYAPRYRESHYRDRPVVVRENFYREERRDERHEFRGHDRGHDRGHEGGHDRGHEGGHEGGRGHEGGGEHGNGHGNGHGKHGD